MSPNHFPQTDMTSNDVMIMGYGCVEDRLPILYNGSEIESTAEYKQVPGADAFFSSASDVIDEANNPGSVNHSLVDTVEKHILMNSDYQLHNDDAHGGEFDGCGFLAKQSEIYDFLSQNVDELFKQTQLPDGIVDRARQLAAAAGRLSESDSYFAVSGGELVEMAVEKFGANLLTYTENHTASTLVIDERDGFTYNPRVANDTSNDSSATFNLDADTHLIEEAEKYNIDGEDAIIFASIVSVATVRVLGAKGRVTVLSASDDA